MAISEETINQGDGRFFPSSLDAEAQFASVVDSRGRLKFSNFEFERFPKGRCRTSVGLTRPDGLEISGSVEALAAANSTSELRCAAEATVEALHKFVDGVCRFELLGVKAVKAFNTTVVIVALTARFGDQAQRLVGSYLAEDSPERGAALAILNATNRYLCNPVFHL